MRASIHLLSFVLTLSPGILRSEEQPLKSAEILLQQKRPLVIGHRGFSAIAPENTLPSFDFALTAGVDLVELDYHHSSDGVPIVIHDYTLDRTTDNIQRANARQVRADTRAANDLLTLDAGAWFNSRFRGTRLPSLNEALDYIQQRGMTLIERKAGDAATCIELLRSKKLINSVVVQAFDWDYLRDFHRLEPKQILGALGPPSAVQSKKLTEEEKILSQRWIDEAKASGASAVVWNKQVTGAAVDYAHKAGLKIWVYTINDPKVADEIVSLGVDGLITDNPALIWKALAVRKY
jgi:glycerophosphoryl diester phosphodiesterase